MCHPARENFLSSFFSTLLTFSPSLDSSIFHRGQKNTLVKSGQFYRGSKAGSFRQILGAKKKTRLTASCEIGLSCH